ncbi:MAG: hypothetical protein KAY37_01410, partial [Phycisphaerae bacterium]|nr:hypothetical protein [Phycisphaerae bacterium]
KSDRLLAQALRHDIRGVDGLALSHPLYYLYHGPNLCKMPGPESRPSSQLIHSPLAQPYRM